MRVEIIGGGPGGLYTGALLGKAHPDWEIIVHERNPPGVTYGFGIVLPKRTLSKLEAADAPSHATITERFTMWEPFDLYYGGERFRSKGHAFASMMRTDLLAVLQERARAVGVDLRFESTVDQPARLTDRADLVVAADGIHSRTRAAFADDLGTQVVEGAARYSWFGTEAPFEALSHIFVENEHGVWCAHTYPGRTSTFIIDCDPETWARAPVDGMDQAEYLAYFEDVFADHLDGHEIISEQDRWRRFKTVYNERWHTDGLALLGDAAHTAHYSIGSGTTLALEDGIALAAAFEDADGGDPNVARALAAYQARRKPTVDAIQTAAERSRIHFDEIDRYYDLEGPQFAVHHLTRSGRISYGSLKRRDPELMAEFDRWFAARTSGPTRAADERTDPISPARQPLELAGLSVPNRLVGVLDPATDAVDGHPTAAHRRALAALGERPGGGTKTAAAADRGGDSTTGPGLVLTDPVAVSAAGRPTPGSPGLYDDAHVTAWAAAVDAVHETGRAAGVHLVHAGQKAARDARVLGLGGPDPREDAWTEPLGRAFPTRPAAFAPTVADTDTLAAAEDAFVAATRRAKAAGFDYLQLHAGHGYLLSAFCSPVTNDRTDAYGGDRTARLAFPRSVIEAVRAAWDGPLGVTLQADDEVAGGLGLEDAFVAARTFADAGADLVAPVTGGVDGSPRDAPAPTRRARGRGDYSDAVRNETGVPTMATSHATTLDRVDTLVGTGRAELCTYAGPPPEA